VTQMNPHLKTLEYYFNAFNAGRGGPLPIYTIILYANKRWDSALPLFPSIRDIFVCHFYKECKFNSQFTRTKF